MRALALSLVLLSCAHAQVTPLQVTEDTMHAARLTFEATSAGLMAANDSLTEAQRSAWNTFALKFKATFHLAYDAVRAAEAKHDESGAAQAGAALGAMLGELAAFEVLLASTSAQRDAAKDGGP